MIDMSEFATASSASRVAVNRPAAAFRLTSSSMSRSTIGERPDWTKPTLISDFSTPTTS